MSVLVASDLSFRSVQTIRRGLRIANDLSLPAEVVHVVDDDLPAELRDNTVAWAKAAISREAEVEAKTISASRPAVTVLICKPKRDVALHAYRLVPRCFSWEPTILPRRVSSASA